MDKNTELSVLTQNSFFSKRLNQVKKLIKENPCDIYCFQEISGNNIAIQLKKECKSKYRISNGISTSNSFISSKFCNLTFSRFPFVDSGEINFENNGNGRDKFAGKSLWVEVNSQFMGGVKIYNCYLRVNFQGMYERNFILKKILEDASKFDGLVIVCGDMNTVIPDPKHHRKLVKRWHKFSDPSLEVFGDYALKDERFLFYDTAKKYGFEEITDLNLNTWSIPFTPIEAFNLKLDWMLYKGFSKRSYKFGPWIGDHRAIIGKLNL